MKKAKERRARRRKIVAAAAVIIALVAISSVYYYIQYSPYETAPVSTTTSVGTINGVSDATVALGGSSQSKGHPPTQRTYRDSDKLRLLLDLHLLLACPVQDWRAGQGHRRHPPQRRSPVQHQPVLQRRRDRCAQSLDHVLDFEDVDDVDDVDDDHRHYRSNDSEHDTDRHITTTTPAGSTTT